MCPASLAGDEVHHTVAIYIDQAHRVELAELHALLVLLVGAAHDLVLDEGAVGLLLEPAEAIAVAVVAGDDIIPAIAIHVIGIHVRSATGPIGTERAGMKRPVLVFLGVHRLFEPAFLGENVHASVSIYIARAVAVRVTKIFLIVRRLTWA